MIIEEQEEVLKNQKQNMLVSASAGSGKTYIMIKLIAKLICEKKVPVKDLLVLTFTKAAANEMKERLLNALKESKPDDFVLSQIDALSTANISTIHSFCEKSLKKYANLLEISENFEVLDENVSKKIKDNAFEAALKEYAKQNFDEYFALISAFKNQKEEIKKVVLKIQELVSSVADRDKFFDDNFEHAGMFFDNATTFLMKQFKTDVSGALKKIEELHLDQFHQQLKDAFSDILESQNIEKFALAIEEFSFPFLPKRKDVGDEMVEILNNIKKDLNKMLTQFKSLRLTEKENMDFQKNGIFEKNVLNFFKIYEKNQSEIKKTMNLMDFSDLEKYMKILSEKENLFAGIKYVVIDEYQDTNKVQERIVKNIAKNSNFVAVGDAKQGIYGFRLASAEIFLGDIENFEKDENSTVKYLKSNFRSSQKVLDFVNDVFSVCMTKELTGIDYLNGSMLCGRSKFAPESEKAVNIDIVAVQDEKIEPLPEVYSVKNAKIYVENKHRRLLLDIKRRIQECLMSQISDGGVLRNCTYKDIAILSRKRDDVFEELEEFLQNCGIPVLANSKNVLTQDPQIKVLLNILKIAKNVDDDVALMSVLTSPFAKLTLDKIANEKLASGDATLCQVFEADQNGLFKPFKETLNSFLIDAETIGIHDAFERLFSKTDFYSYINMKQDHLKLNALVEEFLSQILISGFDFDLPNLISYFEKVEIQFVPEPSQVEDAVLLTTIHNSKGLEYPIVFLIGCDKSLSKSSSDGQVEINETFGMAVKFYDAAANRESPSVRMMAIKNMEKQKDFVEELMIFYVALTRAKNRLYLFGEDGNFEKYSLRACDCYFDLIFFALREIYEKFVTHGKFSNKNLEVTYVEEIEEKTFEGEKNFDEAEIDENFVENLEKYLNFQYKIDGKNNFKLKESVTSLSQKNLEEPLQKFANENFSFSNNMIETGNAYHLALKILDFDLISDKNSLEEQLQKNKDLIDGFELLDVDVLLKNILILKQFTDGADKVFKEKEFIMKQKINDIFENRPEDDEILVQGVVDLFVVKNGKIVLIDFKYSNSNSEKYLIEKYFLQLKSYKIALEDALKMKVEKCFLLSLKNAKLIKVEI